MGGLVSKPGGNARWGNPVHLSREHLAQATGRQIIIFSSISTLCWIDPMKDPIASLLYIRRWIIILNCLFLTTTPWRQKLVHWLTLNVPAIGQNFQDSKKMESRSSHPGPSPLGPSRGNWSGPTYPDILAKKPKPTLRSGPLAVITQKCLRRCSCTIYGDPTAASYYLLHYKLGLTATAAAGTRQAHYYTYFGTSPCL